MDILIFLFNMIKEWIIYTGQEMINNPERTIIYLLVGIGYGIGWTLYKWIKDIIIGR